MATATIGHDVESIGVVSGLVWHYLEEQGPSTLTKLARDIDAPRDLVMQGIGWLARENKIQFIENGRSKQVALI